MPEAAVLAGVKGPRVGPGWYWSGREINGFGRQALDDFILVNRLKATTTTSTLEYRL